MCDNCVSERNIRTSLMAEALALIQDNPNNYEPNALQVACAELVRVLLIEACRHGNDFNNG